MFKGIFGIIFCLVFLSLFVFFSACSNHGCNSEEHLDSTTSLNNQSNTSSKFAEEQLESVFQEYFDNRSAIDLPEEIL